MKAVDEFVAGVLGQQSWMIVVAVVVGGDFIILVVWFVVYLRRLRREKRGSFISPPLLSLSVV